MLQTKKLKKSCGTVVEVLSVMNLEHLIFTLKGRHLALALFASILQLKIRTASKHSVSSLYYDNKEKHTKV